MKTSKAKNFVPKGAASFQVDHDGQVSDVYFLMLPNFTMLALSAAVEPLRIANQVTGKELYRWFLMSETGEPIQCSNGIDLTPDGPLHNLNRHDRLFVCSGTEPAESTNGKIISWLGRQRAFGCKLGGLCTGAFALAKAGVLTDRRFTLHCENQPAFNELHPNLQPTPNLYEIDDELMTCGGGTAAVDMMLDMIERDFGNDLAIVVSDMCIHSRSNNSNTGQKSAMSIAIGSRNQKLISAMQIMQANIEDPLSLDEIGEQINLSRRQLERLFQKYVGSSPAQCYNDFRVARAHALLSETELPISQIAVATGFGSTAHLNARYKKKFGESPGAMRRGWSTNAKGD